MSARLLDPSVPVEAHAGERLTGAPVVWLGTVGPGGRPHTVPVWFTWDDPTITIFSRPDTAKIGHLRAHDAVSVALDTAEEGTDVVTGSGHAVLTQFGRVERALDAFGRKYGPVLGEQPLDAWLMTFSLPIVVTLDRLVAWRSTSAGLEYASLPSGG
ncbi:pyridoxamine 5'-phosphate oxidase family protein [Actinomycetospora straminea]|uniref:Pyridoxamine 5'-phosphate oxidase N-terminal domain-containing protein n=1 Tax=Actinomycetospora straminea TaxID=663607 RepID=A0ABP9F1G2_9PSEU|nr:pyridoxamine 5'-phosphate oxidase family protein [Actinomycetospora straminea]MDD7934722.1 pyridoxamine 5'-phosphate oxidase family protein [Actinomycetospora straminea]